MSRQFRILPIAMTLKNNQIGHSNDIVDETQLNTNAEELIQAGFLEVYESESKAETEVDPLDAMNQKELLQFAEDNDFEVEKGLKKPELLEFLKTKVAESKAETEK